MNIAERNLDIFRICPECGCVAMYALGPKALKCAACGFVLFFNAAAAVVALIADEEGRLLVTVRGEEPRKGTWDLAGGFVDPGESVEEALRRELIEELALELESARYFCSAPNDYEYAGVTYATTDLAFLCCVVDHAAPEPRDDVRDCLWVAPSEMAVARFGSPSIRAIVRKFLSRDGGGA